MRKGDCASRGCLISSLRQTGCHKEHSPDYHRMVYETLKGMIDAGLVDDDETIAFALRIEEALSWFVTPTQHIANFGDSDYRLMARKSAEAERKWSTESMRYVSSNGAIGNLPSQSLMIFQDGGYAAMRRFSASAPDDFSQSSYLAQIACFHSRTHKHADDLSFVWSDRGSPIIVDAGRYGYIGKAEQGTDLWLDGYWYSDPKRVYCESTRAHNTIEFDDINHKRKGVKPYGSALKRSVELSSGVVAIETECKHHGSIRHARVLVFNPGQWLLVFDWYHDNLHQERDVKQWFHVAPDVQIAPRERGYEILPSLSSRPVRVIQLLDGSLASDVICGSERPAMQGWWSGKEREFLPSPAFCFELNRQSSGTFATLFSFSSELKTNKISTSNAAGRKANFTWQDEDGYHFLTLIRPKFGDLNIIYEIT